MRYAMRLQRRSLRRIAWLGILMILPWLVFGTCGSCQEPAAKDESVTDDSSVDPHGEADEQLDQSPSWSWQKSASTVALLNGDQVLWQFNHGPELDMPFFHPIATARGHVLTWNRPPDHVWHHGLWFSWKYINGVNYWEHNRKTGRPDGLTSCVEVKVETRKDHSATISMNLSYQSVADGKVVLREHRQIVVSSPATDGTYHIDWTSSFTAVQKVLLDRTPPKAQSWGGYAGLSVRFAGDFTERQATGLTGPVAFDSGNRHRSQADAMDYSGLIAGDSVGLAMLDHPQNPRHPTPWYLVRSPKMSYINAALLNDEPLLLEASQQLNLRYRLLIHQDRWNAQRLRKVYSDFATLPHPSAKD